MFSPGFASDVVLPARIWGFERRFGQPSIRNWGVIGAPAPTCSLTRGEFCDGLLFSLPETGAASVLEAILVREALPPINVTAQTEFGDVPAYTWPMSPDWNDLPIAELARAGARNIAEGGGPSGNAWDYVDGVLQVLNEHHLVDTLVADYHRELASLVAVL